MAWSNLPTDYTDAVWSGLKKYKQISNSDGTVSFEDKTTYTNREKSFFGAENANQMNEAINDLMSIIENGRLSEAKMNTFVEAKMNTFVEEKTNTFVSASVSNHILTLKTPSA